MQNENIKKLLNILSKIIVFMFVILEALFGVFADIFS